MAKRGSEGDEEMLRGNGDTVMSVGGHGDRRAHAAGMSSSRVRSRQSVTRGDKKSHVNEPRRVGNVAAINRPPPTSAVICGCLLRGGTMAFTR